MTTTTSTRPHAEHSGAFEFGLDLILDSLERLRDSAVPADSSL